MLFNVYIYSINLITMKTTPFLAVILLSIVTLSSCKKVSQTKEYTANKPVYMSYEDLRSSIKNDNNRSLVKPGKIFLYNQYILINDFEEGIHVYNNSNPTSPEHIAFIEIPGNVDRAVMDDVLYADSYVDIVSIDFTDPRNVEVIDREENALSYTIPSQMDFNYPVSNIDPSKGVVLGYEIGEVTEKCSDSECGYQYYDHVMVHRGEWDGNMMSEEGTVVNFAGTNNNNVRSMSASNTQGALAGSMARFIMVDDHLYVIADGNNVKVFAADRSGLSAVTSFQPWSDAGAWGTIETLFSFKEHLFIGSTTGMLAYDVSSPSSPSYLSMYTHMTACDPVVANDDYAFVTLRAGNECGMNQTDQLDVLDISNIMNPFLIGEYQLTSPKGLALDSDNELLFVCDGESGMVIYDINNINSLDNLGRTSGDTYDVIAHNNIAHVIGNGGLVQYQYNADGSLTQLSKISLQ
ncbi:MAG: hypothetical protein Salg2KO_17000 [Salibacteraceae bacterium]